MRRPTKSIQIGHFLLMIVPGTGVPFIVVQTDHLGHRRMENQYWHQTAFQGHAGASPRHETLVKGHCLLVWIIIMPQIPQMSPADELVVSVNCTK